MILVILKLVGISEWNRERLKMSTNTFSSWSMAGESISGQSGCHVHWHFYSSQPMWILYFFSNLILSTASCYFSALWQCLLPGVPLWSLSPADRSREDNKQCHEQHLAAKNDPGQSSGLSWGHSQMNNSYGQLAVIGLAHLHLGTLHPGKRERARERKKVRKEERREEERESGAPPY